MLKFSFRRSVFAATVSTLALATVGQTGFAADVKSFDIEAQPLAKALLEFNKQSGLTVAASSDLVAGKAAPAIQGTMDAEAALQKILGNSGLQFTKTSTGAYLVSQAAGANSTSGAGSMSDADEENVSFVLEEIIVTAEKRAESLQDIPIAISAFSGNTIEQAQVSGINDLKQLAPSLQFGQASTDTFVSIRGIGSELKNVGAEAGVIISQDGVPLSNTVMMSSRFLDIERIEVLRGPQGTISGRNATGGAIKIHSKKPTEEFEGGIKVALGNYNRVDTESHLSGPIADSNILARLVVSTERADGWLTNTLRQEDSNDVDAVHARATFLTNLSEDLEAFLVLESRIDHSSPASNLMFGTGIEGEPSIADIRNVSIFNEDTLEYEADWSNDKKLEEYRAVLKLTWDINPNVSLSSTSGYISFLVKQKGDFDATSFPSSVFDRTGADITQFSQEFTLAADLGDNLDLIAGVLYMNAVASQPLSFGILEIGIPAGGFTVESDQNLDSYGVYAQVRYQMANDIRLTLGARYSHDKKSLAEEAEILGSPFIPLTTVKGKWSAFTPRVAVDYTPNDDITLYASVSRGFKAGGFNTFERSKFNPEYVWNYEVGMKGSGLDNHLQTSLTGFYMDYTDLQQGLFVQDGTGITIPRVENASAADIWGVEAEIRAQISEKFILTASGTWLDATFTKLLTVNPLFPDEGEQDMSGNQLTRSPEWQLNVSGIYTMPVNEEWQAVLRADYFWQDHIFFDFFNNDKVAENAYGLLNFSASLETMDGRWQLTAFARNAFNKRYKLTTYAGLVNVQDGGPQRSEVVGLLGEPQMYGISLAYNF